MTKQSMTRWQAHFPADLLAQVDAWAKRHKVRGRSAAVRDLLTAALGEQMSKTARAELDKLLSVTGVDDIATALRIARRTVEHQLSEA